MNVADFFYLKGVNLCDLSYDKYTAILDSRSFQFIECQFIQTQWARHERIYDASKNTQTQGCLL